MKGFKLHDNDISLCQTSFGPINSGLLSLAIMKLHIVHCSALLGDLCECVIRLWTKKKGLRFRGRLCGWQFKYFSHVYNSPVVQTV